jgi:hypothetical protein
MTYQTLQRRLPNRVRNHLVPFAGSLDFEANKSSMQARKIVILNHNLVIELWFNKHYYKRYFVGDENGKRQGIDPTVVEALVARCIEHLFLYGAIVKNFVFVNPWDNKKFPIRIVLQETKIAETLNVVIEVHQKSFNRFEITVITAMVSDEFKMASGQYCIKVQQDRSLLRKVEDGKVVEICSCQFS